MRDALPRFIHRVPGSPWCPTLYACSLCGALMLSGVDFDQHERWHQALTAAIGDVPVVTIGPAAEAPDA